MRDKNYKRQEAGRLGEVRTGRELGRNDSHKWIWLPCEKCGKERWVGLRNGQPRFKLCQDCGSRGHLAELGCKTRLGGENHPINGSNHPMWKGGFFIKEGYIWIWTPDHPRADNRGYVKRARLVLEVKLGRYLLPGMVVHHVNGNKLDDRPENLEELPTSTHNRLPKRKRCAMTKQQAGQLGGIITLIKHGQDFYSDIGAKGGRPRDPTLAEVKRQQSAAEFTNLEGGRLPNDLRELRVLYELKRSIDSRTNKPEKVDSLEGLPAFSGEEVTKTQC